MRGSLRIAKGNGLTLCSWFFTTVTVAVEVRCGTMATSFSGETTLKVAGVLPNKTESAPSRFFPTISTRVPSGPPVGEIRRTSGAPDEPAMTVPERKASRTNLDTSFTENYRASRYLWHRKHEKKWARFPQ